MLQEYCKVVSRMVCKSCVKFFVKCYRVVYVFANVLIVCVLESDHITSQRTISGIEFLHGAERLKKRLPCPVNIAPASHAIIGEAVAAIRNVSDEVIDGEAKFSSGRKIKRVEAWPLTEDPRRFTSMSVDVRGQAHVRDQSPSASSIAAKDFGRATPPS